MNVEFVDTNVLIYAHDGGAGKKHAHSVELLTRIFEAGSGALSIQVLSEFCFAASKKLGMKSREIEQAIQDLRSWTIHRPSHSDVIRACEIQRRYKTSWWDALVINSAMELGCTTLWSEDLAHGQRYGGVRVQNPYS